MPLIYLSEILLIKIPKFRHPNYRYVENDIGKQLDLSDIVIWLLTIRTFRQH